MPDDELDGAKRLSIPEVHHLLEVERANRGELSYEQQLALDHAKSFDRLGDNEDAEELRERLSEIERVTEEHIIRILEVLPKNEEELVPVFSEDRRELSDEDADTIISIVSDYV